MAPNVTCTCLSSIYRDIGVRRKILRTLTKNGYVWLYVWLCGYWCSNYGGQPSCVQGIVKCVATKNLRSVNNILKKSRCIAQFHAKLQPKQPVSVLPLYTAIWVSQCVRITQKSTQPLMRPGSCTSVCVRTALYRVAVILLLHIGTKFASSHFYLTPNSVFIFLIVGSKRAT